MVTFVTPKSSALQADDQLEHSATLWTSVETLKIPVTNVHSHSYVNTTKPFLYTQTCGSVRQTYG